MITFGYAVIRVDAGPFCLASRGLALSGLCCRTFFTEKERICTYMCIYRLVKSLESQTLHQRGPQVSSLLLVVGVCLPWHHSYHRLETISIGAETNRHVISSPLFVLCATTTISDVLQHAHLPPPPPSSNEQIVARNDAGTRFIVCFSSRFDACSSAIAGVLVNAAFPASGGPAFNCSCPSPGSVAVSGCGGGGGAISEDARTVSTCSSFSDTEDDDRVVAPCSTTLSVDLARDARQSAAPGQATASPRKKGAGGGTAVPGVRSRLVSVGGANSNNVVSVGGHRASVKRASSDGDSSPREGVEALLLDEKPKHRLCNRGGGDGSGGGGGNPGTAGFCGGGGGVVHGMPVQEWVQAYGECEGPMLAAWVFPGQDNE